jgi:polyisoprenyl-phosphate glycosyltransferase
MDKIIHASIVVSVFNEEQVIDLFYNRLMDALKGVDFTYEVIFVNDGSTDHSFIILDNLHTRTKKENIKIISLSKNFGHEAAMIAGIDKAIGDAIICIDADLQHPPMLIPAMIGKFLEGYDIINMVRTVRKDGGLIKNVLSNFFYRLINKISELDLKPNASDFFLISRRVADVLRNNYRENIRFLRGIIQSTGFNKTTIEFIAPKRMAGESKYSFINLFSLSLSVIAISSKAPLRIAIIFSLIFGIFSLLLGIFTLVMFFMLKPVSGYTTIVVFLSISVSIILFVLGIICEYLGHILSEVKAKPIYIIDKFIE